MQMRRILLLLLLTSIPVGVPAQNLNEELRVSQKR